MVHAVEHPPTNALLSPPAPPAPPPPPPPPLAPSPAPAAAASLEQLKASSNARKRQRRKANANANARARVAVLEACYTKKRKLFGDAHKRCHAEVARHYLNERRTADGAGECATDAMDFFRPMYEARRDMDAACKDLECARHGLAGI
jgi:hypothetical protein